MKSNKKGGLVYDAVLCGTYKSSKICAKPKVYNKTLCGAVVKSLDEYYGGILESDDSTVSHLLSCDYNLSPADVIEPMQKTDLISLSQGMEKYVIPLLNPDMIPLALLSLQDMALSTVSADEAKIGRLSRADLVLKVSFNPADFFADIFYFVATGIENKAGKETIDKVTEDYVNSFGKNKDSLTIEETVIVETQELERTLDDDGFEAVFREVNHGAALSLKIKAVLTFTI